MSRHAFPVTLADSRLVYVSGAAWDQVRRHLTPARAGELWQARVATVGALEPVPEGVEVVAVPHEPTVQERAAAHIESVKRAVWLEAAELVAKLALSESSRARAHALRAAAAVLRGRPDR